MNLNAKTVFLSEILRLAWIEPGVNRPIIEFLRLEPEPQVATGFLHPGVVVAAEFYDHQKTSRLEDSICLVKE